jgi:dTMP kinase
MRGAFITLEGTEGVGKSTCLPAVQRLLEAAGHSVLVTREPGGTPLGERIRDWVLDAREEPLSATVEALLMFAARAHHLEQVIRPAIARGLWVVCDRFTDATLAYQGGGRGAERAFLEQLKQGVHGDLEPDLTLLFDAPVEVGLARIADREQDSFEKENHAFFERVRRSYLALAREQPERIRRVDATRPLAQVEADVEALLSEFAARFGQAAHE